MTRYQKLLMTRCTERLLPASRDVKKLSTKKALVLLTSPVSAVHLLRARKKPILPYLEFVVTERCTLKCKNCANLMQHYCTPESYPLERLMKDADELEKRLSAIWVLQLLGGEPLMYPGLETLLAHLCGKKFIRTIQVVTNGTLLPKEAVLRALQNEKVIVHISNYGDKSVKLNALKELLSKNGIRYKSLDYTEWMDYGDLSNRGLSQAELNESYRRCPSAECKTLLKGHIYACPRSAHMDNLGLGIGDGEAVDIYDGANFNENLGALFNRPTISACDHCNPPWARPPISPGEQMPRD